MPTLSLTLQLRSRLGFPQTQRVYPSDRPRTPAGLSGGGDPSLSLPRASTGKKARRNSTGEITAIGDGGGGRGGRGPRHQDNHSDANAGSAFPLGATSPVDADNLHPRNNEGVSPQQGLTPAALSTLDSSIPSSAATTAASDQRSVSGPAR